MLTLKKGVAYSDARHWNKNMLAVGDRVMTKNGHCGIVKYVGKDESGEYIIVTLEDLFGEYAFEFSDVKKLQSQ